MKVFVDVGSHVGQTLEEVVKPRWGFDKILALEPMKKEFNVIVENFSSDKRIKFFNYGLLDYDGEVPLYGDNSKMEASIYAEHSGADSSIVTVCQFVSATKFLKDNTGVDDQVIVKLNCEGSEVKILNDLLQSGHIHNLYNVMIDFDVRKCAGHEHEEGQVIRKMKADRFTRYSLCEKVMRGPTHQDRIAAWLETL